MDPDDAGRPTAITAARRVLTITMARRETPHSLLKMECCTLMTQQTPDHSRSFILYTDVSNRGVGAVLSQVQEDGMDLPIAFYSRKFLPRETRYTTTEKECLAVINAVRHFEVYLLGRQFDIVTDHGALQYLTTIKHGGARLSRWALALQPFSYTIRHQAGLSHSNSDGLSRQGWTPEDVTLGTTTEEGEGGVGNPPTH